MIKVITYGTYDLLHEGHILLMERAKALGDYLIVGVTAEDFDKSRGKINVQQSLMERIENVKSTGLADKIIVEEYEGQKIDDIRRYGIDIFAVGSDWIGKFDYLNEYCKVIYLERTKGISSSELRNRFRTIRFGMVGNSSLIKKYSRECKFVNGLDVITNNLDYSELLNKVDAVYIVTHPTKHYKQIKEALIKGKHVLCESPLVLNNTQLEELMQLADEKKLVLMEAIKTAYSTAYYRLLLLIKSGCIGKVVSVDAVCTSLRKRELYNLNNKTDIWNSICAWGPTALLPVFQILGSKYQDVTITSSMLEGAHKFDVFSKIDFIYPDAVASVKVGKGVKSEGELIVSGTKGYIYVPAPWWKMDYFEVRYEDSTMNKRYFYQLEGEGIRYMLVAFAKSIRFSVDETYIDKKCSKSICNIMDKFYMGDIKTIDLK